MNDSLVLNCNHNGINCIQKTDAKRPCDRIWFTEAQICEWSGMAHSTMYRKLKLLKEKGRICISSDLDKCKMPTNNGGSKETTIYNLNVLNQLAMVCIESDALNETAKKFSDILSEVETTGSYGVTQISQHDQLLLKLAHAETPEERILVHNELYQLEHKTELKRSMTAIGKLGGITTARNIAIKERDEAKEQLKIKQEELDSINSLYNEVSGELDGLKESIGQSEEWQSSAQLMNNYPELFGTFKSTNSLTRFLKKRGVLHKLSDHPDSSGYLFTIFKVEEAMNVVK